MSSPPFTTPQRPGRLPPALRRRRRRRQRAAILFAIALLAVVLALVLSSGSGDAHHSAHASSALHHTPAPAPTLSPAGLRLAKPAFALTGLASAPLRIRFHAPPSAGLLFDLDSGRVLWERHATERRPIASLTKMMTALLTVRSVKPDEPVLVTRQAVAEGGSKVGVLPLGRHVRAESMLYGLMLPSGNDAAVALAQHVAGSIDGFITRMNEEAAALGMGCTRYSSPSGYYDAGNFSCPLDLALLAHVDLAEARIARVVKTYSAVLPFPIKGGKLYLYNNNPLLVYGYPGATGLKTGYTIAAGRCLIATAERHGVRLGVVLLHSPAPGVQAKELLDAAFSEVYHVPPIPEPAMPPSA
jgi:D-alanyl-D-alanine carboxypeptidase